MKTIRSLAGIRFDSIYMAFNEAFKDYEMQLNKKELRVMLSRRGFIPGLSFAAFDNDKIVAFTFNGIGTFNGQKTAYDTGTGTLEEYRGKGLASEVFNYSVAFLKEAGVSQYLLEVLQHNPKAISVYKSVGFEVSREFNYFVKNVEDIRFASKNLYPGYSIEKIDLSEQIKMLQFCDFVPSWQNNFDAIRRRVDDFISFGTFKEKELVGFCIFEPGSGDITLIAVDKAHRRKGIATNLLNKVAQENRHDSMKLINSERDCESITKFMEANSMEIMGRQFEMIKQL